MKMSICSIFTHPGYNFKVSYKIHAMISKKINSILKISEKFKNKYGEDFELGFIVATEPKLKNLKIKGPTTSKKESMVDYTIWIPYEKVNENENYLNAYLEFLFSGILEVFKKYDLSSDEIQGIFKVLKQEILANHLIS